MAGVDFDVDSDKFQDLYLAFTRFPPVEIFDAQHKISEILNKYFEESNRANRQRQSCYYATERWKNIKIAIMNKLAKVKSHLQSWGTLQTKEICKLITDHQFYIEVRDSTELLISMVKMTYGLHKYQDRTTTIIFIDALLEKINSHAPSAREQDWLEMIRILDAARVESGNGKMLDLELLLNQFREYLNPTRR